MYNKKDLNLKPIIAICVVMFIALVAIAFLAIQGFREQSDAAGKPKDGTLGGLLNTETDLFAPDPVTKEDLEEEHMEKDVMALSMEDAIFQAIDQHMSVGDFEGLDDYLADMQANYRTPEDESGQAFYNWETYFPSLRSDLQATINLNTDNAATTWVQYTEPIILASAIAYTPISVKREAFADWSAALFPAVSEEDAYKTDIHEADVQLTFEERQALSEEAGQLFIASVTYDMTLFNYQCQLIVVQDATGYWRPYTLQCVDGHLSDPITRSDVDEIERHIDLRYHTVDDIISVAPFDQEAWDQTMAEHPEWFDENGAYIRPEPTPEPAVDAEEGEIADGAGPTEEGDPSSEGPPVQTEAVVEGEPQDNSVAENGETTPPSN